MLEISSTGFLKNLLISNCFKYFSPFSILYYLKAPRYLTKLSQNNCMNKNINSIIKIKLYVFLASFIQQVIRLTISIFLFIYFSSINIKIFMYLLLLFAIFQELPNLVHS